MCGLVAVSSAISSTGSAIQLVTASDCAMRHDKSPLGADFNSVMKKYSAAGADHGKDDGKPMLLGTYSLRPPTGGTVLVAIIIPVLSGLVKDHETSLIVLRC